MKYFISLIKNESDSDSDSDSDSNILLDTIKKVLSDMSHEFYHDDANEDTYGFHMEDIKKCDGYIFVPINLFL